MPDGRPTIIEHWDQYELLAGSFRAPVEEGSGLIRQDGVGRDARFVWFPYDHTWNPRDGSGPAGLLLFGAGVAFDLHNIGDGSYLRGWDPDTNEVSTLVDFSGLDSGGEVQVWGVEYSPTTDSVFVAVKPRDNWPTGDGYVYELNASTYATLGVRQAAPTLWRNMRCPPSDPGFVWCLSGAGQTSGRGQVCRYALADDPWPFSLTAPPILLGGNGSAKLDDDDGGIFGTDNMHSMIEAEGRVWWANSDRPKSWPLPFSIAGPLVNSGSLRWNYLSAVPMTGGNDLILSGKRASRLANGISSITSGLAVGRAYADGSVGHFNPEVVADYEDDLGSLIDGNAWGTPATQPFVWDTLTQTGHIFPIELPLDGSGRQFAYGFQGNGFGGVDFGVNGFIEARHNVRAVNRLNAGRVPDPPSY